MREPSSYTCGRSKQKKSAERGPNAPRGARAERNIFFCAAARRKLEKCHPKAPRITRNLKNEFQEPPLENTFLSSYDATGKAISNLTVFLESLQLIPTGPLMHIQSLTFIITSKFQKTLKLTISLMKSKFQPEGPPAQRKTEESASHHCFIFSFAQLRAETSQNASLIAVGSSKILKMNFRNHP